MNYKFNFVMFSLMISCSVYADKVLFPKDCLTKGLAYKDGKIILHSDVNNKPQIYLLHNISKQNIILDHVTHDPGVNAGWGSELRPGNWSAFMVSQPKFSLLCSLGESKKFALTLCNEVVVACYFENFVDKDNQASGSQWLIENKSHRVFMDEMQRRHLFVGS